MNESFETPYVYTVVRQTWLSRKPNSSAQLVTTISLLFLILASVAQWRDLLGWGSLWPASAQSVFEWGQYWRLWTTVLTHADMGHLVANSLLFYILGYFLYGYFGGFVFPLSAFAMGGLTNALVLSTYPSETQLIGASGVVSWMGGVWLILYLFLNTQISWMQRSLRAIGVALVLFAPSEAFDPKISYRTHLVGFALGLIFGLFYYLYRRHEFKSAEVIETIVD